MSDGDLLGLLNQIKDCWPQFPITKENLLHPTKDLVVKFYSNFINECFEKIAYLTRCEASDDLNMEDLTQEEWLFQQLSRLLVRIHSFTFTLLDIYQPTHKVTRNIFKLCVHFMMFIEYSVNEIEVIGNNVFKIKEETTNLLTELEEILQEIEDNAKNKVELVEFNKNILEHEYIAVKTKYKEMKDSKAVKEKLYAEKKIQIDNYKLELQNEECELNRLRNREEELQEQRITDCEYKKILNTLESLKKDSDMLESDDVNIEDGLVLENEALKYSANCNGELSKFDFDLEIVKALIRKEAVLRTIFNDLEKLYTHQSALKQQKFEGDQNLATTVKFHVNLQNDCEKLKENYTTSLESFTKELARLKEDAEEKYENNIKEISSHNEAIIKLEEDLECLRKTFMEQYIKVSTAEKCVADKFRETLLKNRIKD